MVFYLQILLFQQCFLCIFQKIKQMYYQTLSLNFRIKGMSKIRRKLSSVQKKKANLQLREESTQILSKN